MLVAACGGGYSIDLVCRGHSQYDQQFLDHLTSELTYTKQI